MKKICLISLFFILCPNLIWAISDNEVIDSLAKAGFDVSIAYSNGVANFQMIDPTCFYAAFNNFLDFMQNVLYFMTIVLIFSWGLSLALGSKLEYKNSIKNLVLVIGCVTCINPIMSIFLGKNPMQNMICDKITISLDDIHKLLEVHSNDSYFQNVQSENAEINATNDEIQEKMYDSNENMTRIEDVEYNKSAVNMCVFDDTMEKVFKYEGGYVNNKNDRGGETKYGISKRSNPDVNIKELTKEGAKDIYYSKYYKKYNMDKLPPYIAPAVFDWGVNHGPVAAIKDLQSVLGIEKTGKIDDKTLKAIDNYNGDLFNAYIDKRELWYKNHIENNPSQKCFEKGWMHRAEDVRANFDDIGPQCIMENKK